MGEGRVFAALPSFSLDPFDKAFAGNGNASFRDQAAFAFFMALHVRQMERPFLYI